jgi:hypothetical protein
VGFVNSDHNLADHPGMAGAAIFRVVGQQHISVAGLPMDDLESRVRGPASP